MSAEASRNPGIGEPTPPRRPESGFSRLLGRLFTVGSATSQGVEDFTSKIHQVVGDHFATVRHQELERKNAEVANIAYAAEEKSKAAQRQRDLEQKRATALAEIKGILGEFQIEEKLKYIQKNVWGGKGRIRIVEPEFSTEYDKLGGLELVHQYPFFRQNSRTIIFTGGESEGESATEYRYEPKTGSTSLSIAVLRQHGSEEDEKVLAIHSVDDISRCYSGNFETIHQRGLHTYLGGTNFFGITIPISSPESEALLGSALAQEVSYRLTNKLLPSQIEEIARKILAVVKQRPGWHGWTRNYGGSGL